MYKSCGGFGAVSTEFGCILHIMVLVTDASTSTDDRERRQLLRQTNDVYRHLARAGAVELDEEPIDETCSAVPAVDAVRRLLTTIFSDAEVPVLWKAAERTIVNKQRRAQQTACQAGSLHRDLRTATSADHLQTSLTSSKLDDPDKSASSSPKRMSTLYIRSSLSKADSVLRVPSASIGRIQPTPRTNINAHVHGSTAEDDHRTPSKTNDRNVERIQPTDASTPKPTNINAHLARSTADDDHRTPSKTSDINDSTCPSPIVRAPFKRRLLSVISGPHQHETGLKRRGEHTEPEEGESRSKSRRARIPWTTAEEIDLLRGVLKFGKGEWASIRREFFSATSRTGVDLKDKWTVLIKGPNADKFRKLQSELNRL